MASESSIPPQAPPAATFQETAANRKRVLDAAAAVNAIQNHPLTQGAKDTVVNGPVAESVKNQAAITSSEFSGLANSKTPPTYTAATGQKLTHYHSFFYTLLSWEHPRATAIAFVSTVIFIFSCRYLPILPWALRATYLTLGVTALAEVLGKFVLGHGLATSVRPRQYYKIPKEVLESSLDDLEQLINFFVIEFQRILFAENPIVTIAAFASALLSYLLIKILPIWGLTLLGTCIIYTAPLIYIQNKEFIDGHLNHAHGVITSQASQVKDLAAEHAGKGFESVKAYTGDYAAKAQELVGSARTKIPSPTLGKSTPATGVKEGDFPTAPKTDLPSTATHTEPTTLPAY